MLGAPEPALSKAEGSLVRRGGGTWETKTSPLESHVPRTNLLSLVITECAVPHPFRSSSKKKCGMGGKRSSLIGILSLALLAPLAVAQQPATNLAPPLAGIAHAAIRVADLDASRAFYRKLGFEEAFAFDKNGVTTQSFIKINDRQFIELYPRQQPSDAVGFMHVCFDSADIAALNAFYRGRGLTPNPVRKAAAGNLLFTMEGLEHQNIEYTQYMPGSRHSNDFGQHLGPDRISTALVAAELEMQDPQAAKAFYTDKLAFTPAKPLSASSSKNDRVPQVPRSWGPGSPQPPSAKLIPPSSPTLWLQLPGFSTQSIAFIPHASDSAFRMIFAVDNLNKTAARLRVLGILFSKTKKNNHPRPRRQHPRLRRLRSPHSQSLISNL